MLDRLFFARASLREEEVEHQRLVRDEIAKTPPDPALPDDAWGDEPTAP